MGAFRCDREDASCRRNRRVNPRQHGDWIDGDDFIAIMSEMGDTRFDVMLEAKHKDPALLHLREELAAAGLQRRVW